MHTQPKGGGLVCGHAAGFPRVGTTLYVVPSADTAEWPAVPGRWVAVNGYTCRIVPAPASLAVRRESSGESCWADGALYDALRVSMCHDAPLRVVLEPLPTPTPVDHIAIEEISIQSETSPSSWLRLRDGPLEEGGHLLFQAPLFLSTQLTSRVFAVSHGKAVGAADFLGKTIRITLRCDTTGVVSVGRTTTVDICPSPPVEAASPPVPPLVDHLRKTSHGIHDTALLEELAEAVMGSINGGATVGVILEGASGAGKSHLCNEVLQWVDNRNSEVAVSSSQLDETDVLVSETFDVQDCFRGDLLAGGGRAVAADVLRSLFRRYYGRRGVLILEHVERLSSTNDVERIGILQLSRELERLHHSTAPRLIVLVTCHSHAKLPQLLLGPCRLSTLLRIVPSSLQQRYEFLKFLLGRDGRLQDSVEEEAGELARLSPAQCVADLIRTAESHTACAQFGHSSFFLLHHSFRAILLGLPNSATWK
eukprot:TRINITY_DN4333_c0_g1_i1.p1 TRINITY_DN4333_c0_g1~~TRINITY_DN4333_c0_g1_i1.p1  ORF type:complete len:497 (+),score=32.63 TRINITY_DN4333_c0_g1_i1:56-1492(+)